MAKVIVVQTEGHSRWKEGELLTVRITGEKDKNGGYVCETLETYPADLKELHAAEIESLKQDQEEMRRAHHDELERALLQPGSAPSGE